MIRSLCSLDSSLRQNDGRAHTNHGRSFPAGFFSSAPESESMRLPCKQAGVVLVLTLWMLTLLTIMAAGYSYAMRTETQLAIHGVELAKARATAEAGLWLAVADLLERQEERQWQADGTLYQINFGEGKINLKIQDEAGKIDLNTASDELLRGLLETYSLPEDDVTFLLHAILDWRDPDKHRRKPGAEDSDYETAGYGAKDGPFNSIEELRLVAGMTNAVYKKIYPALTLHSLQPGINPMVAPREVLLALPGSQVGQIDEFLATRNNTDEVAGLPPGLDSRYFTGASDLTFAITSEGMAGRSRLRLDLVVTLNRAANPPYSVLSWRESKPAYAFPQSSDLAKNAG